MNAPTPTLSRWVDRTATRWFYVIAAVLFLVISLGSFAPEIADRSHALGPYTWLIIAHGVSLILWLLVLIGQPALIQIRSLALHRRIGLASIALAAAVVLLGYATAIAMARRGFDISGSLGGHIDHRKQLEGLIFPLVDVTEFGLLVTAGYFWRRNGAAHKRLMLFSTVALLPAPFAHFIGHNPALGANPAIMLFLIILTLIASSVYDLSRFRRIHPVSLWLGLGLFVMDILCATIVGPSAGWHRFAIWLTA
jgi:hypothetical protein